MGKLGANMDQQRQGIDKTETRHRQDIDRHRHGIDMAWTRQRQGVDEAEKRHRQRQGIHKA